ncbi:carbohydrate sulfotransferase 11-like isoform X3 [Apostichopus japonicus]|uniref:carbohydrate sulfotransferase 11-like isoform X3 n=1 Tax=Stichopus japonicus TaxID=307972 RepID=UPI003AB8F328
MGFSLYKDCFSMAGASKTLTFAVMLLGVAFFVISFSMVMFKDSNVKLPESPKSELSAGNVAGVTPRLSKKGEQQIQRLDTGNTVVTFGRQSMEMKHPLKNVTEGRGFMSTTALDKETMSEANASLAANYEQSNELDYREWNLEQARRKAILRETCAQHPNWNMSIERISRGFNLLWPFIYDDKYKVIYCTICKVASTTWKSVFLVLMGKYNSTQAVDLGQWYTLDRSLHTLQKLRNPAEIEKRLRTYKKFIFVREPFSRELSGYRNKLHKMNKYYQKTIGTKIIRQFRKNPDKEALQTGVGVTFTEFVKYLTKTPPESLDIHWRPMYKMVLPCAIEYDYIGHLETADWDTHNILKETGINHVVEIPSQKASNLSGSNDIFNGFFNELNASLVQDMYNTFKYDVELFGYPLPELIAKKLGRNP